MPWVKRLAEPLKLILTHDNADFDAISSMLAAYKLDPLALPVLPARVNRNVEHFLNLYGSALPFVPRDELRRGAAVESVTVVDTQSFSTARGMRPNTPIHFIDHHPLARNSPPTSSFPGRHSAQPPRCSLNRFTRVASRLSRWKLRCCSWHLRGYRLAALRHDDCAGYPVRGVAGGVWRKTGCRARIYPAPAHSRTTRTV